MKAIPSENRNRTHTNFQQVKCYFVFCFIMSPVWWSIYDLEDRSPLLHQLLLFFTGFITFTFFEYIAHRFWMHGKEMRHPGKSLKRHMDHHHHPTELKISPAMRTKLLLVNLLFLVSSVIFVNYFTLLTGLFTGFVYYCFMHLFLHQPWAHKFFPRLQQSHIHHHCKYPDRCFSTCITWWDRLFNTNVPEPQKISRRIVQFYFGKPHP